MNTKKWMSMLALALALAAPVMGLASGDYGAAAVREGETYTVEQMLVYALQDEYLALAEYKAIMEKFGVDRPFGNIMKAEQTHVEHLLPLFAAYKIPVPEDTSAGHVTLPETLEEVYQTGVTVEINNIKMYETFLKQEGLPEDVKTVLQALKNASENHLAAFERNLNRPGSGQGLRAGSRRADEGGAPAYGRRNQPGNAADSGSRPRDGRGRRGN